MRRYASEKVQTLAKSVSKRRGSFTKLPEPGVKNLDDAAGGIVTCPLAPDARVAVNSATGSVLLRRNSDGTFSPV